MLQYKTTLHDRTDSFRHLPIACELDLTRAVGQRDGNGGDQEVFVVPCVHKLEVVGHVAHDIVPNHRGGGNENRFRNGTVEALIHGELGWRKQLREKSNIEVCILELAGGWKAVACLRCRPPSLDVERGEVRGPRRPSPLRARSHARDPPSPKSNNMANGQNDQISILIHTGTKRSS